MPNKNFLLLSLEDSKTKKIANVVSNESCKKILDYLAKKEATESELAEKLQIPISTVHYNLQQLMETGLINTEEFHYSKKGKEVLHYKLANKYIIISPKSTYGLKERLKGILPVALLVAGAAGLIQILSNFFPKKIFKTQVLAGMETKVFEETVEAAPETLDKATPVVEKVAETVISKGEEVAAVAGGEVMTVAEENITTVAEIPTRVIERTPVLVDKTIEVSEHNIAIWFLVGALFALVVYFVWGWIRKRP